MAEFKRQSPVRFTASPIETEERDHWTVALEYENEGHGPWIGDLAHKARWDLQDGGLEDITPCDLIIPEIPGQCTFSGDMLINRMNRTQASIYHLGSEAPPIPDFQGYTDVSESSVFLALFGPNIFSVAEKLTRLDFMEPGNTAPFLLQGPFCHVPCQIVVLDSGVDGGFLLTCSRGYGDSMVHAILEAGAEIGLRPAGEKRFGSWIAALNRE
ncbi:hypothetical protein D3OALGA1CA_4228 [Olavius algarvensis associated proteobacterium Delta 3]|nr:hypothetical protein D3OALGB2SA_4267 [Olavius algarvensis associated proteobacterium Delta 3]CAB5147559.1 hypothetical protein D3OALGA1CA_4228 [Olavius algarvensis associated proteobacterium Delta 3]